MNTAALSQTQMVLRVITWTVAAAKEHVDLARFSNEEPDSEVCMGLRQSFDHEFPKVVGIDHDLLMAVWSHTFTETVKALIAK